MKNLIYIFLLSTQVFFAQNGFENGNKLFKNGDYSQAISEYETVFRSKKHSSELYFNIANCYYKLGKVAPAIYNYEKALLLDPKDQDIYNNLELAKKLQIDDIKVIETVGFSKWIKEFSSSYHYNSWAWISVGLAMVFLLFFVIYYFSEASLLKRAFFTGMLISFLMIVISISAAIYEKNKTVNIKPAIIFANTSSLKTDEKSSKEIRKLHEGTKVYILLKISGLSKVQLTDGVIGWIDNNSYQEIR